MLIWFAEAEAGLAIGNWIWLPVAGSIQLPIAPEPSNIVASAVVPSPSIQITITSSVVEAETPAAPAGPCAAYTSSKAPERW